MRKLKPLAHLQRLHPNRNRLLISAPNRSKSTLKNITHRWLSTLMSLYLKPTKTSSTGNWLLPSQALSLPLVKEFPTTHITAGVGEYMATTYYDLIHGMRLLRPF